MVVAHSGVVRWEFGGLMWRELFCGANGDGGCDIVGARLGRSGCLFG